MKVFQVKLATNLGTSNVAVDVADDEDALDAILAAGLKVYPPEAPVRPNRVIAEAHQQT